jgi:hypothetical protein
MGPAAWAGPQRQHHDRPDKRCDNYPAGDKYASPSAQATPRDRVGPEGHTTTVRTVAWLGLGNRGCRDVAQVAVRLVEDVGRSEPQRLFALAAAAPARSRVRGRRR